MLRDCGPLGVPLRKLSILYDENAHRRQFMNLYGFVNVEHVMKALQKEGFVEIVTENDGTFVVKLKGT